MRKSPAARITEQVEAYSRALNRNIESIEHKMARHEQDVARLETMAGEAKARRVSREMGIDPAEPMTPEETAYFRRPWNETANESRYRLGLADYWEYEIRNQERLMKQRKQAGSCSYCRASLDSSRPRCGNCGAPKGA